MRSNRVRAMLVASVVCCAWAVTGLASTGDKISLNMRDVSLAEVMELLSHKYRTNIVLTSGVAADVSVNLYDMELEEAIYAITDAAGFAVENRSGSFFIMPRENAGKYKDNGLTVVETFEINYVSTDVASQVITPLLSSYGEVVSVPERRVLIVRDRPEFIAKISKMMAVIDRKPRQILIEAKILELTLDDSLSYGFDWSRFFTSQDGEGSFGTQGLSSSGGTGAFFSLSRDKLNIALNALRGQGRVRTLSAPRLLALENQEASVVIGDRQGFRVTTTINQISTESIEFLESGVILRVTPTVDAGGAIMLDIHPEVSTGTITDGIPSQTTTEVTTQLLLRDGHSVFIGGLIKNTLSQSTSGVPILGSVPVVRRLFSSDEIVSLDTETIVIITPRLVDVDDQEWQRGHVDTVRRHEQVLERDKSQNNDDIEKLFPERNVEPAETARAQPGCESGTLPENIELLSLDIPEQIAALCHRY